MAGEVSKSDWKHFKSVREQALERLCNRILDRVREAASDESKTSHERFLSVYELVNESNDDVAHGFDFLSRSRMVLHLAAMQSMELLEEIEIEGFSDDVRQQLLMFSKPQR